MYASSMPGYKILPEAEKITRAKPIRVLEFVGRLAAADKQEASIAKYHPGLFTITSNLAVPIPNLPPALISTHEAHLNLHNPKPPTSRQPLRRIFQNVYPK